MCLSLRPSPPLATTGRGVHPPACLQANRIDGCGTQHVVVFPPSLRSARGRRLCRQSMPHWIGLEISTGTGLCACCICIRTGQLPRWTHRHGMPSQGGFEQRSAHTFAEMARALVEDEKATVSAKARLQSMIVASRILRPKCLIPSVVGMGSPHATSAPKLGSLATHQHRILESTPAAPAPIGGFASVRL